MSWFTFGLGLGLFLVGLLIGYFVGKRKLAHGLTRTNTDKDLGLVGLERKVYDVLVKGDGIGFFVKVSGEVGISRKEMEGVVKGLKGKKVLRVRSFANRRRLELRDFLKKRERKVLDFVGKRGEVSFSEIMSECDVDDNLLGRMGKKFVRMGLIVKVARGYETFFVLTKKVSSPSAGS